MGIWISYYSVGITSNALDKFCSRSDWGPFIPVKLSKLKSQARTLNSASGEIRAWMVETMRCWLAWTFVTLCKMKSYIKRRILLICKLKSQNVPESKNTWFWEMLLDSGTCFVFMCHAGTEINLPRVRKRSSMDKFGHFLWTEKILFLSLEDTFGVIVRLVALKFNSTATTTLFQYSGSHWISLFEKWLHGSLYKDCYY